MNDGNRINESQMSDITEKLYKAVLDGDPDLAKEAATEALEQRVDPLRAIEDGLVRGIREVGEKFGKCQIFLTELVIAAEAFKSGVKILEPELLRRNMEMKTIGTFILGTVAGDIHSIGKDIVGVLLSAAGFEVHDLGVDVPAETFIQSAREHNARIIGASALLSTSAPQQKTLAEALRESNLKEVKFIIGGAAVSEAWAKEVGADAWALSASDGVEKAKKLMSK